MNNLTGMPLDENGLYQRGHRRLNTIASGVPMSEDAMSERDDLHDPEEGVGTRYMHA